MHSILASAGHECYVVGGAVRSLILGLPPKDWDIATDAHPEDMMRLFHKTIPTGVKHGTVTIRLSGHLIEATTYRVEGAYSDGRHPERVDYSGCLFEDLSRRDFSINAMALDIPTGNIIDPHGGRRDCREGVIRAIGTPVERFSEDGLRILRAVRFAAQLGFSIEAATIEGIKASLSTLRKISWERIRDEFVRIIAVDEPSKYLLLMGDLGVLSHVLPELEATRGVLQGGRHQFDVFLHSLYACDGSPADNLPVRLAALLHDLGKPRSKVLDADGSPSFHGHEALSAADAEILLRRLRFPIDIIRRTVHLIRHHMFNYESGWSDAALRRFVSRVGREQVHDLVLLRIADRFGFSKSASGIQDLLELMERIRQLEEKEAALGLKDLAVNGTAVQAELGIPAGPAIGTILNWLLEAVLDDPALNESVNLLRLARNFYEQRLKDD